MVQALCRRNGTGPYSRSGSTKAELAPPSSFSLRPTFPRRPAASSSRPSAPAQQATTTQFLSPIVVSALGDPVHEGSVASLSRPGENITGTTFLGPEPSRHLAQASARCRQVRGCALCKRWEKEGTKGLTVLICDDNKQEIQNLSDALYEADTCRPRSIRRVRSRAARPHGTRCFAATLDV
jgi:hypothetical protein